MSSNITDPVAKYDERPTATADEIRQFCQRLMAEGKTRQEAMRTAKKVFGESARRAFMMGSIPND